MTARANWRAAFVAPLGNAIAAPLVADFGSIRNDKYHKLRGSYPPYPTAAAGCGAGVGPMTHASVATAAFNSTRFWFAFRLGNQVTIWNVSQRRHCSLSGFQQQSQVGIDVSFVS